MIFDKRAKLMTFQQIIMKKLRDLKEFNEMNNSYSDMSELKDNY